MSNRKEKQMLEQTIQKHMVKENQNNQNLIEKIAAGSESALQTLYAEYGKRMYAYALTITHDPAQAQDITQDSLVAVWEGAKRFRGDGRIISWLMGIVHHKAMRSFRKQKEIPLDEENSPTAVLTEHRQANHLNQFENQQALKQSLKHLPVEQRTILELVFYQGLSLKETAQVCGCPVGTVKSRLSHAKTALRGSLQRSGLRQEDF